MSTGWRPGVADAMRGMRLLTGLPGLLRRPVNGATARAVLRLRLERLLLAHSEAQPWHESLAGAIEPTIARLVDYRGSQARDLIPDE